MKKHEQPVTVETAQEPSERAQLQDMLQENARLAAIGELAAGLCHEINNPLSSVLGFSQLVLAEDLPQNVKEDVQRIFDDARRASKIVQNLLSLARKQEPQREFLDLTVVLDRALELRSYEFRSNNIQVSRDWTQDLPRTMADEHQLIQVFLNIIANAEQAIQGYTAPGQLTARVAKIEDRLRISISDNGPGIQPQHMGRIFEPFFTTKEAGRGTGLGLSTCYRIVQQHGGDLWAESTPGLGATFHLELPILANERTPEMPLYPPRPASAMTRRLLVVDDENNIRELIARCLAMERCTVDLAHDGQDAWQKVRGMPYDCVILDLKMPGMSGRQLFQTMKEFNSDLASKTIFITGDTVSASTREFLSGVSNPVLSKPFELEELRSLILQSLATPDDPGFR